MRSENVLLTFTEGAIREIARVAFLVSIVNPALFWLDAVTLI
jgi:ATP-dependent protease HslVU (ClpYQ) ATPase subunit